MKLCKKITNDIAKSAEWICMAMIALLVLVIVAELVNRNFFGNSFRPTIEICGIAFLWMAFIGIIALYNNDGLMKLDFLSARLHGVPAEIIFFIRMAASLMLGVVMVIAFFAQYPFVSTRTYATFAFKLPYTIQYIPMGLAGAFMALKSVELTVERILKLVKGASDTDGKGGGAK